ncbi:MAG: 4Fe-4S dicluster domain-containing protein [Clostridia bacterium]|nr:4Fe-4S dicluster domain-containing protein [Clostridia bacterium]
MKKIALKDLSALLSLIAETEQIYLPCEKGGQVNYARYEEGVKVDLSTLKTVKSAKEVFFPQSETLYTMYKEGKKIRITQQELQSEDFILFGVRGCDVKGIEVLDKVFLSAPVDSFYSARRDHGTIVSLACGEPEESCFCTVFEVDPTSPAGDVTAWIVGETLYWKANTEKGEALTEKCASLLSDSDCAEVEAEKSKISSILSQLPYTNLSLESWHGEATKEKFSSDLWKELYKPCLGCGTCTFVCPTCQCYDLKDYDTGNGIQKYRCWDSCMYSDFTMMAHGNNRTSQMQRYRQRFMHKLVYFPANNNGMYSCVGCGRCVDKCPASTNIVKVIKAFSEKEGK